MNQEGAELMLSGVVFRAFPVAPVTGAMAAGAALDPAEERRAAAMNPSSAQRFRAGRIALRQFAAELLNVPASALAADYSCPECGPEGDRAHGRPGYAVKGLPAPVLLSLSRTAGWILLAGLTEPAAGLRLGVDVEDPASVGFAGFDATVLTPAEAVTVAKEPGPLRNKARARLWVRKEAWLKMHGAGLRTAPNAVDVIALPGLKDLLPGAAGLPRHYPAAVALGWADARQGISCAEKEGASPPAATGAAVVHNPVRWRGLRPE